MVRLNASAILTKNIQRKLSLVRFNIYLDNAKIMLTENAPLAINDFTSHHQAQKLTKFNDLLL